MPLLGHVLAFENEPLGLSFFGSPKEILDALRTSGVDYAPFAEHPQTTIDAAEVHKPSPRITLRGGPHAEATLELIEAVREADDPAVLAIVARDPDVVRSAHSGAALLAAASDGRATIVRTLLEAGARVDDDGEFGMTPLHWAAALGSEEIVRWLLDAGADATRRSWFYLTAGELAMLNEHVAIAELIAARSGAVSRGVPAQQILERMRRAAAEP
jgi:hypothetical protein